MSRFTRYVFQCDKCKKEVPTSATDWAVGKATLPEDWSSIGPHHLCPKCLLRMQEEWLFAGPGPAWEET